MRLSSLTRFGFAAALLLGVAYLGRDLRLPPRTRS